MPEIDTPAPATPSLTSASVTVTLGAPIVREGGPIAALTLRKPRGGDLRGTKLTELMAADVDAIARIIPRITSPAILPHEFYALEADDLAEVVGTVVGFSEPGATRSLADDNGGLTVETLIAQIAAVFHWPLSDLVQMELAELIDWRQRAVALWNRMNTPE
jgi:hypothetical protein